MRNKVFIMMLLMLFIGSLKTFALTAPEIIEKANQATYYQGDDGKSYVTMEITDSQGRTREREMTILRMDSGDSGEQKYYVYFHKPSDVAGMAYMVWKHIGKDDDRWLYLPALDLVRRVASTDKRSSFVGSHFAYEEISGRGTEEDDHTLLGEEGKYYKIKSVPKDPNSVEFSYYITWVDKETFVPYKSELFDKNGKHYKTLEALTVKNIDGYPTVTKMKATDLNSGGNTVSEFTEINYDNGINENIFTERYLRRPPRQYMR